ncbi:MAG: DUF805 domain-containing protein [Mycobacterium sp.]|nr:DUF805 domain-containing protein [Mycobacterium sp.]
MPLSAREIKNINPFSFTGRLNRARFWLTSIKLSIYLLPITIFCWVEIATSPLSLAALTFSALLYVLFVYLLVFFASLLVLFAGLAVATKRLHDRDKSAWWLLLFYLVPLILPTIAYYTDRTGTGAVEVRFILVLASLSIIIWFLVELGFLRGTAGPNRYGADPRPMALEAPARAWRFKAPDTASIAVVILLGSECALFVLMQHGPWSGALSETSSSRGPQATLAYSDFLNDVARNQVGDVTIQGNMISGHFTDDRAFLTYAPNDPDLVNRLITKGVRITAAPVSPRGSRDTLAYPDFLHGVAYSDFLNDVTRNQVADVTIQGNAINGHFTDGSGFWTYAPNDPDLVNRLITKGVRITAASISPLIPAAPNEAQGQPQPPASPNATAESGVTGVWTAYDVGFPPWTLTLRADGVELSGTVQQGARGSSGYNTTLTIPAAIYDGEIDGNKITFKCQDPWSHDRTITFTGIVNGDGITFTRTVVVKPGGTPGSNGIFGALGAAEFTAQRAAPSGAASAPATPDQGNGAQPPPAGQKPDIVRGGATAAGRK